MKTELEVNNGLVTISTPDVTFTITISVTTGEVIELGYTETSIHQLAAFISKAKTRYNKFMNSKAIDDFIM